MDNLKGTLCTENELQGTMDAPAVLEGKLDAPAELKAGLETNPELRGKLEPRNVIHVHIIGSGPRGQSGKDGRDGATGPAGADGYTPVKEKDYWTPEDRQEILDEVAGNVEEKEREILKNANTYTDKKISEIPTPDVSGQISEHNTDTEAHNDLRLVVATLTQKVNDLLDSDDTTLDQMSEIVAYIKDNRGLIESVTTTKVNVADIINNLTTNVTDKPLSAAQGVKLKALIDAIQIPTKVSELENDKNYLTEHQSLDAYSKTTDMLKLVYPVGAVYISAVATDPKTLFGFGTWEAISKKVIDTGWQDFSWTNSSYIGTSQSAYTRNQWRVKNNILYVQVGAGATSKIETSAEDEIARIPIAGGMTVGNENRIWTGGVGGSGAVYGALMRQNDNYISVALKPHTSANNHTAPWYSMHFTAPLDDDFKFTTGSYDYEYVWKRTA